MTRKEFGNLIEEHQKGIYSFCYHLAGCREEADELYQDTMLKAMECCSRIDHARSPKNFLIAISIGIFKNKRRKYARRQRIAPAQDISEGMEEAYLVSREAAPEDILIAKEVCRLVRVETAALPEKYRIPVYLYYTAQLPVEEIAAVMHIPGGTVKSRLHKARLLIKKGLEEAGYEN